MEKRENSLVLKTNAADRNLNLYKNPNTLDKILGTVAGGIANLNNQ